MALILVTGSNGQLGNELRVASKNYYGYDFLFTDLDQLDISDPEKTSEFISGTNPDWIVNCAAYNLVDKAESEPSEAMKVNATAVENIVNTIKRTECRFIHISSDYVYNGSSAVPYNETAVPDPQTEYGRSKLEGEKFALQHPFSMVIRTSWLYSSYGNNFVKTILKKGAETGTLKVVFDQTGTPTYAADLAGCILSVISGVIRNQFAFSAGVYNFSNEGACTWYDFAVEIIREAGIECKVVPVLSSDFSQAAKRPSYSVMDKSRIKEDYNISIAHWRESMVKCLKLLLK